MQKITAARVTSESSSVRQNKIVNTNSFTNCPIFAFGEKRKPALFTTSTEISLKKNRLKTDINMENEILHILKWTGISAATCWVLGGVIGAGGALAIVGGATAAIMLGGNLAYRIIKNNLKIKKLEEYFEQLTNEEKVKLNEIIDNGYVGTEQINKYIEKAKEMLISKKMIFGKTLKEFQNTSPPEVP